MAKDELYKKDYLEILDMSEDELKGYKKADLIKAIGQLASELYEMEGTHS